MVKTAANKGFPDVTVSNPLKLSMLAIKALDARQSQCAGMGGPVGVGAAQNSNLQRLEVEWKSGGDVRRVEVGSREFKKGLKRGSR